MNLKEQLEAKKAAASVNNEGALPEAEKAPEKDPIPEVAKATKNTPPAPQPNLQFRKGSFAYVFKYSRGSIKCDKMGVYTPQNEEEFEILKHQVQTGNILFN
jgi:hypothetical protein